MSASTRSRTIAVASLGGLFGTLLGYCLGTTGYVVDWPSTGAMMQGWATLIAAAAAAWGVNRWRVELDYKRRAELAEKVLISVEGLYHAIQDARAEPGAFEFDQRFTTGKLLRRNVYTGRVTAFDRHEYPAELEATFNRVSVLFGAEHREVLQNIVDAGRGVRAQLSRCSGFIAAVDAEVLDPSEAHIAAFAAEALLPSTDSGRYFSERINTMVGRARGLFKVAL